MNNRIYQFSFQQFIYTESALKCNPVLQSVKHMTNYELILKYLLVKMELFQPEEKRERKVDHSLCFICQTKSKPPFTEKPAFEYAEGEIYESCHR